MKSLGISFLARSIITSLIFLYGSGEALAAEVALRGLTKDKALLTIDGVNPRWLTLGASSPEGVKLVSIGGQSVVVDASGQRETLTLGQDTRISIDTGRLQSAASGDGGRLLSATLTADGKGQYFTMTIINGVPIRLMVDTGATWVALNNHEAKMLGIDYLAGRKTTLSTANGVMLAYLVKLDEIRVADVTLKNVEAVVLPNHTLPVSMLGMSFLRHVEMKSVGDKLTIGKPL